MCPVLFLKSKLSNVDTEVDRLAIVRQFDHLNFLISTLESNSRTTAAILLTQGSFRLASSHDSFMIILAALIPLLARRQIVPSKVDLLEELLLFWLP